MKRKKNASTTAEFDLVGREHEGDLVRACLEADKNVLLEGPVGVGKTHLALAITDALGLPVFRVDGDSRYTEQKLSGWFDPPTVIKKGYGPTSFVPGPLVEAMKAGGILFINELNRLPEGVQNILLPAIDERIVMIPRLGVIKAAQGFRVLATQNPKEFVATSHLSEAILDRFELVVLEYQSEVEETKIVTDRLKSSKADVIMPLATGAVRLARMTRVHPKVRRGASVRAALSMAEIAVVLQKGGMTFKEAFLRAALLALPTRIEIEREAESDRSMRADIETLITELSKDILENLNAPQEERFDSGQKKKSRH
ncbi:MAG: MoxR family ATPase [Bdellovibrionota bacterium]